MVTAAPFLYDRRTLLADYLRVGAGLFACGLPLAFTEPMPWLFWVLLALFVTFLAFGLRTVWRGLCRYRLTGEGLELTAPVRRKVGWADLGRLRLRYYTTRRNRDHSGDAGWFQLHLRGKGGKITIDSNLNGFDQVLKQSARAAGSRGLALDKATRDNLAALGIETTSPAAPPGEGHGERNGPDSPS